MAPHVGERLGPYEILGGIGAGGMGEVYRARDTRLDRPVAVKLLRPEAACDPDRLRRFEQEARAAGSLSHPNVLVLYDVGSHEGSPYLVTELLEGETLRQRLDAGGLPRRKAIEYALQTARGLAAAHERGLVHRDLKPENLFVTRDGILKILDFGLARLVRQTQDEGTGSTGTLTAVTDPGVVLGTVGYMSPEQVRGELADHRSDIFTLGAVLYELLSGRRAFRRDSSVETLNAILKDDPPEFTADRPIPPGLDRVVRHCLEKKPEDRFQSARDLAFELESLTGTTGGPLEAATPPAAGAWVKRAAALLVVAAALGVGWFAGRGSAPTRVASYRQLTFRRGGVASARFTPDGQTVFYGAAWDGQPPAIASRRIDGPESKPLGLPPSHVAGVSSKGELAIVLTPELAYNERPGTLARVPLSGGAPREVADDVWCADWAPDGEGLVVRRTPGLWRIEYPIGHVISPVSFGCPRFSPDGRSIGIPMLDGYAIVDVASGRRSSVTGVSDFGHAFFWAWSPRGDEIWFSGSDDPEQRSLQAVSLKGRRRLLGRIAGAASLLDVSRDGRMLIEHSVTRFGVRARGPGEAAERELTLFDHTALFDLSLDGRAALLSEWGSAAGSASDVYLRATTGADPVRLGKGDPLSLSPDGRWFAERIGSRFQSRESWQGTRLRLVPTGAGEARELPFPDLVINWAGWLPDGQRLILTAREHTPESWLRVFVSGLDGSGLRAITPDGVFPRAVATDGWTMAVSDGRRVAVEAPNGAVTLYPIDGPDPPREVPGLGPGFHAIRFSDDGRSLFVAPHQGTPTRVFRVDLATGQRTLVHELMPPNPDGVTTFASGLVTPDGRAYAYGYRQVLGNLYLAEGLR